MRNILATAAATAMIAAAAMAATSAPASADGVYFGTPSVGAATSPHRSNGWYASAPTLSPGYRTVMIGRVV